MDDAVLVCRREARANLSRDLQSFVCGQAADASHQRSHILAIHELHSEECLAVGLADIEDAADVGVRHLSGQPHFAHKTRQSFCVACQGFRQKFQCHGLPELQILGAINFSHAALAER